MHEYAGVCVQYARVRMRVERSLAAGCARLRPMVMPDDGSGGPNLMCCADVLAWLDHKPRTTALQLQVDNTLTANPNLSTSRTRARR